MTSEELKKKIKEIEEQIIEDREKSIELGDSYNMFLYKTRDLDKKIEGAKRQYNLMVDSNLRPFSKLDKKYVMTLQDFKEECLTESITDYDGYGYYATETEVSDIPAVPGDIKNNIIRTGFTNVVCYNK